MRLKQFFLGTALVMTLMGIACVKAPPTLSPQATVAFYDTRVIQALDLVRDIAINANAQTPPLVSTATTRLIVLYHESAITIVHASPAGWKTTLQTTLAQVVKDLPAKESVLLAPYINLLNIILAEVQ